MRLMYELMLQGVIVGEVRFRQDHIPLELQNGNYYLFSRVHSENSPFDKIRIIPTTITEDGDPRESSSEDEGKEDSRISNLVDVWKSMTPAQQDLARFMEWKAKEGRE